MKTSKTSAKVIDSIKTLLLSDNITANKMGIITAQQYGWELCDIANFVVRSNIKKDSFELYVDFYNYECEIIDLALRGGFDSRRRMMVAINKNYQMWRDYIEYDKKCTHHDFNKAIKLLVKNLTQRLSNDQERTRNNTQIDM